MTKTMKMISATKLRRTQEALRNAQQYAEQLSAIIGHLMQMPLKEPLPLITPRPSVEHVRLLVVTSDRGLCGGFNNNLFKAAARWLAERRVAPGKVSVSLYGQRGIVLFRGRWPVTKTYTAAGSRPSASQARQIGAELQTEFLSGGCDEVYLAYNQFHGVMSQRPTVARLLPLAPAGATGGAPMDFFVEPELGVLLEEALPPVVSFVLLLALLHSAAGEMAARMTAMENATNNADDLIDRTTLWRNRARQAAITKELAEIIGGAEALRN
jgi:F-type H+-transporting ATPase subunit gamma